MTFFHFLNSAALAFGPHLVLQHFEQSTSGLALASMAAFFVTQLVRISVIAPVLASHSSLIVMRLCDIFGLFVSALVLSPRNPRLLAIFWALMDSLSVNCFKQYRLIRAFEFDPEAFESAFLASPQLFTVLAVVISFSSYRRYSKSMLSLAATLLSSAMFVLNPFLHNRSAFHSIIISVSLSTILSLGLLALSILSAQRAELSKKRA